MSVSHGFSVQIAAKRRDEPAPPKWSKGWTDLPQASDRVGAYTAEELERMNQDFTAVVERAFRTGGESEKAATATPQGQPWPNVEQP
jgi:hypothetical protein